MDLLDGMRPLPDRLLAAFGVPDDILALEGGATAWSWDCDPDGEAIAVARSASDNVNEVLGQVRAIERKLDAQGRSIGQLIISLALSGNRRFHERPDLLLIEEAVMAPSARCRVVVFSDLDRLSRSREAAELFISFLLEHNVGLELASWDRTADEVARTAMFMFERVNRFRAQGRK